MKTYDRCTDCLEPFDWSERVWLDDDNFVSPCCAAPVEEVPLRHGDDCMCWDCSPLEVRP